MSRLTTGTKSSRQNQSNHQRLGRFGNFTCHCKRNGIAIQPGKLSSLAVSRVLSTSDIAGAESGFGAFYLLRISSFLILAFSFLFAGNKTSCISVFKDFIDSSQFWTEDWIMLGDFEAEELSGQSACLEVATQAGEELIAPEFRSRSKGRKRVDLIQ